MQIDFEKLQLSKSQFFDKMKQAGINLQVHYIPVHLQPYYRKQFSFKEGDYPKAEKFYKQEISLPIYPKLTKNDQNLVIDQINHIYASK